ncbi:MAG: hypothetical protein WCG06_00570, partial [Candidatus Omnitrophota bacterium]
LGPFIDVSQGQDPHRLFAEMRNRVTNFLQSAENISQAEKRRIFLELFKMIIRGPEHVMDRYAVEHPDFKAHPFDVISMGDGARIQTIGPERDSVENFLKECGIFNASAVGTNVTNLRIISHEAGSKKEVQALTGARLSAKYKQPVYVMVESLGTIGAVLAHVKRISPQYPRNRFRVVLAAGQASSDLRGARHSNPLAILNVSEKRLNARLSAQATIIKVEPGTPPQLITAFHEAIRQTEQARLVRHLETALGRPVVLEDLLKEDLLNRTLIGLSRKQRVDLICGLLPRMSRLELQTLAALAPFYAPDEYTLSPRQLRQFSNLKASKSATRVLTEIPSLVVTPSVLSEQSNLSVQRKILAAQLGLEPSEVRVTLAVSDEEGDPQEVLAGLIRNKAVTPQDVGCLIRVRGTGVKMPASAVYSALQDELRRTKGASYRLDPEKVRMASRGELYLDNETAASRSVNRLLTILQIDGEAPYPWILVKLLQMSETGRIILYRPRAIDWGQVRQAMNSALQSERAA